MKITIHWEAGPQTYESAEEAAKELNKRGITMETQGRGTTWMEIEERLQRALPCQRTMNPEDTSVQAKKKKYKIFKGNDDLNSVCEYNQTIKKDRN